PAEREAAGKAPDSSLSAEATPANEDARRTEPPPREDAHSTEPPPREVAHGPGPSEGDENTKRIAALAPVLRRNGPRGRLPLQVAAITREVRLSTRAREDGSESSSSGGRPLTVQSPLEALNVLAGFARGPSRVD